MSKFLDKNIHNSDDIDIIRGFLALLWDIAISELTFENAVSFIEDEEYSTCNDCCELAMNCTCPTYNDDCDDDKYDSYRDFMLEREKV